MNLNGVHITRDSLTLISEVSNPLKKTCRKIKTPEKIDNSLEVLMNTARKYDHKPIVGQPAYVGTSHREIF